MKASTLFKLQDNNTYFHYDHINGSMITIVNDGCYKGIFTRCDSNCAQMVRQYFKEDHHNVPMEYRDYQPISVDEWVTAYDKALAKLEETATIMFKSL